MSAGYFSAPGELERIQALEDQPIGAMRMLKMVNLSASDLARQNLQRTIDRFVEDGPGLRNQVNDHRVLVQAATQALSNSMEDGSREVCQERLDAVKEFERNRDLAFTEYFDLKHAHDEACEQLAVLNQTSADRATWALGRDNLAMRLRGGERSQMAILLPMDQVIDLFKRFKRVTDNGTELQGMAKKFTAALSHFSKLKVLARIAYIDDQRAAVKEEEISEDVLNDQRRTLASLRKGIKTRMELGAVGREQLIIWDIETRVAVFMLVAAEDSGGILPQDFDQWTDDQPQSHCGTKRKRGDIYSAVSKALMAKNPGRATFFKAGNIKEMATQGKVIYSFLKPYGRHWSTVLPLADFCREVDSLAHKNVLKVQPYLWKTLQICLAMIGLLPLYPGG